MNTASHRPASEDTSPRQELIEAIHELPETLVIELLQFASYLRYRESSGVHEKEIDSIDVVDGNSEGYRKMRKSGFIGMIEAEPELSTNYKSALFDELRE